MVSTKGPNGGFALGKKPDNITLWDIVTKVDGEEFFTNCLITLEPCKTHDPSKPLCPIHAQYDKLRTEICSFYKETTLAIISSDIEKYEEYVKL